MSFITIQDFGSCAGQHHYTTLCLFLLGGDLESIKAKSIPIDDALWKKLFSIKSTRIVSTLCRVRTSVILHRTSVETAMRETRSLYKCEAISNTDLIQLEKDGVNYKKWPASSAVKLVRCINVELGCRLGNCEAVNGLEYGSIVKNFLQMPNGKTDSGVEAKLKLNLTYPAKKIGIAFMNLPAPYTHVIWNDDAAFLSVASHAADMPTSRKQQAQCASALNKFLETANRVCVYVDCENVDPYRLCAAMNNIASHLRSRIKKIVLIDDENTSTAWLNLSKYVTFKTELVMTNRVLPGKSVVDGALMAAAIKAYYAENIRSFILCSSDSDMWTIVGTLCEAKFHFLLESTKCSQTFLKMFESSPATYCMIDDMVSTRASYYFASSMVEGVSGLEIPLGAQVKSTFKHLRIKQGEACYLRTLAALTANASVVMDKEGCVRLRINAAKAQPAIANLWANCGAGAVQTK